MVKVPPYMPHTDQYSPDWSFCEQDMKDIRAEGFNGVRLGMMYLLSNLGGQEWNQPLMDIMKHISMKCRNSSTRQESMVSIPS